MAIRIERKSGAGKKVTFVYTTSEIDRMIANMPEKLTLESRFYNVEEVQVDHKDAIDDLDGRLTELNDIKLPELEGVLDQLDDALDDLNNVRLPELDNRLDQLDDEIHGEDGLYDQLDELSNRQDDLDDALNDPDTGLYARLDGLEDDLDDLDDNLGDLDSNLGELDDILGNPESQENFFSSIATNQAWIDSLVANQGWFDNLFANEMFAGKITTEELSVDQIVGNEAFIKTLVSDSIMASELVADTAFITELTAEEAFIEKLVASTVWTEEIVAGAGFIEFLTSDTIFTDSLIANRISVETLVGRQAFVDEVITNVLWADEVVTNNAFIDSLLANNATLAGSLTVGDIVAIGPNVSVPSLSEYSSISPPNKSITHNSQVNQRELLGQIQLISHPDNANATFEYTLDLSSANISRLFQLVVVLYARDGSGVWQEVANHKYEEPFSDYGTSVSGVVYGNIGSDTVIKAEIHLAKANNWTGTIQATNMNLRIVNVPIGITSEGIFMRISDTTIVPYATGGGGGAGSAVADLNWSSITNKPFNTVGSNLTVSNGALTTNLSSLSTGTGLSGSSYNGSTGRTFSLDTGYTDNRYYTQSALSNGSVDLDLNSLDVGNEFSVDDQGNVVGRNGTFSNQFRTGITLTNHLVNHVYLEDGGRQEIYLPWPNNVSRTIILEVEALYDVTAVGTRSYTKRLFYLTAYQYDEPGKIYAQESHITASFGGGNTIYIGEAEEDLSNERIIIPVITSSSNSRNLSVKLTAWGRGHHLIENASYQLGVDPSAYTSVPDVIVEPPVRSNYMYNIPADTSIGGDLDVEGAGTFSSSSYRNHIRLERSGVQPISISPTTALDGGVSIDLDDDDARLNWLKYGSNYSLMARSSNSDLGLSDYRWRDLHLGRDAFIGRNLRSINYTSGIFGTGWTLDNTSGSFFEIDNLRVRKEFRTHIFRKDEVRATNSLLYVSDASEVAEQKSLGTGSQTLVIRAGAGFATFAVGDRVLIQRDPGDPAAGIVRIEATVTGVNVSGEQNTLSLNVTYGSGIVLEGDTIVRISGSSILLDASTQHSPFIDALEDGDVLARFGKLTGITKDGTTLQGSGLFGTNTYLTDYFLIGDLSKQGQYMEFSGNNLTIVSGDFDLQAGSDYWRTTGGNSVFRFGGSGGITYDGDVVKIGSSTVIEADIEAVSGTIGGWDINDSSLTSDNVGLYSSGTNRITAGSNNQFRVTSSGAMYSTSGNIGGWSISSNSLTSGNVGLYNTGDRIRAGTSNQFRVTNAGALHASNANIQGSITATSGSLSNVDISGTLTMGSGGRIEMPPQSGSGGVGYIDRNGINLRYGSPSQSIVWDAGISGNSSISPSGTGSGIIIMYSDFGLQFSTDAGRNIEIYPGGVIRMRRIGRYSGISESRTINSSGVLSYHPDRSFIEVSGGNTSLTYLRATSGTPEQTTVLYVYNSTTSTISGQQSSFYDGFMRNFSIRPAEHVTLVRVATQWSPPAT